MLIRAKKNIFLYSIIFSVGIYACDSYDDKEKEHASVQHLVNHSKVATEFVHDQNLQASAESITLEEEESLSVDLEEILHKAKKQSDQLVSEALNSDIVSKRLSLLTQLKTDDCIEFKADKIGLGSALVGASCVGLCNRCTNPGYIRKNIIFRRALGASSAYVIYKLVATNDPVKKNICNGLSKLKKD